MLQGFGEILEDENSLITPVTVRERTGKNPSEGVSYETASIFPEWKRIPVRAERSAPVLSYAYYMGFHTYVYYDFPHLSPKLRIVLY